MLEKSANCISTIGRIPSMAAPIAVPTIASSLIGVFRTRPGNSFRQTFRGLERAAKFPADVLPVNENALVLAQEMRLGFADGFEVGDAHRNLVDQFARRDRAPIFFASDRRRFALRCLDRFFHFGGNFRAPFLERLGVGPVRFRGSTAQCALHNPAPTVPSSSSPARSWRRRVRRDRPDAGARRPPIAADRRRARVPPRRRSLRGRRPDRCRPLCDLRSRNRLRAIDQIGTGKFAIVRRGVGEVIIRKPRSRTAPFPPRRCSSLRASRRFASRLRRSSLGRRNPFSPFIRFASSLPTTTGIIAPRWLIMASCPVSG